MVTGYLHRLGIRVRPYLDDWLIHHQDRQVLLRHQARHQILPPSTSLFSSVPVHGVTQLGLRSYPSGSFVPETPSRSLSLIRSDGPFYATASIRSFGPCQPSTALTGPMFSYLRNPYPHVSGGIHDFYGRFHSRLGRSHGGFPDFGYLDPYRPQTPYQLAGAQGGSLCPKALGPVLQGHQVMIATDNSTVVSYINKQGGTRSPTFLRLTVELFLWLEAQNIIVRARHIPGCLYVIADHISRPNQPIPTEWSLHRETLNHIFGLWGTPEVDMFTTVSNFHLPWSNSRATSPSGGRSVSGLAGEVNVHVSSIPSAQQSHSEALVHLGGRGNSRSRLVAETVIVSTSTSSLCGPPPVLSQPSGSEVCLRWKVVPSACMEALMRHYKAAGFSDEVSRLTAAPRRPSTNRMYDDRWLRFSRWAAGQGFDPLDPTAAQIASFLFTLFDTHGLSPQTVKVYRTCLGSVLNRTGNAKVVMHQTISDMTTSMELQRPRVTPVLPQ